MNGITLPPFFVAIATVSFTRSPERAAAITAAPSFTKRTLSARPMPFDAPVMIATFPSSNPIPVLPDTWLQKFQHFGQITNLEVRRWHIGAP